MAKVTLIAHTPDPEKLVAASAKLCYSPATISDLMDGLDEEKTTSFLNMLTDFGHQSPIEHISFTFGIEEVSRTLLAYLLHRTAVSFVPARFTGLYFLHLHLCKHIFTNTTSLFNLSSDTPDRPP